MEALLISEEGLLKGLSLPLKQGPEWTLGRDPEQSSIVIEDASISRLHGKIKEENSRFILENLTDPAALKVNEQEISTPTALESNDLIQIGDRIFRFVISDTNPTESEPTSIEEDLAPTINEEIPPEINFNVDDTGRFLLKVISGPNSGAEFYMHAKEKFILGVDPKSADIVFNDTSVSRQHAVLTLDDEGKLTLEDLNSKNGTFIDGTKVTGSNPFSTNQIVSLGMTSFVVYDREGEMHTILSPLLPSIVKMLQKEEPKPDVTPPTEENKEENKEGSSEETPENIEVPPLPENAHHSHLLGIFVLISFIMALFVSIGFGVYTIFESKPIGIQEENKEEKALDALMKNYPSVRANYNRPSGKLFLIGHLLTDIDKNQLLYALQSLKFLKTIDDSGVVIDEYVWREMNQVLSKRSEWKGVTFYSPSPGKFVVSGYLKKRSEADALNDYITSNFLYISLLDNQVIVEDDLLTSIKEDLRVSGFPNIQASLDNGEVILTGQMAPDKKEALEKLILELKKITGVKGVIVNTSENEIPKDFIDISGKYPVGGISRLGTKLNALISGKILYEGDYIDGMKITSITYNKILLEKDNTKYEINF